MGLIEVFLVGVGLSMDAFAVSICKGLCMKRLNGGQALVIALFFGGFQALMPLLGYCLGSAFAGLVSSIDHWIAFVLLALIGGKMIWDAFHDDEEEEGQACDVRLDLKELTMLAIATSIDALAVGITFAFLEVNVVLAVIIIGVTTFVLCLAGVGIGHVFGARFEKAANIFGGVVLIGIGTKILVEHLFF